LSALDWLLAAVALAGHMALCVGFFNRLHAVGMHRRPRRWIETLLLVGFWAAIGWYGWWWWRSGTSPFAAWHSLGGSSWPLNYANICVLAGIAIVPCWLWPRLGYRGPAHLVAYDARTIDVAAEIGPIPLHGLQAKFCSVLPGNQFLRLQVTTKTLRLPTLPRELDGITVTHLSDLHFTGEIDQKYFDFVIDQANQLASDVVILSGDIIESTACESWIVQTVGRLQAPLGKYYVLGNHDKRMPDVPRVRRLLGDTGLVDLGGHWLHATWKDCRVLLAGNERPWFPAVSEAELASEATSANPAAFRLLVSHSPDQLRWARRNGFSLMLSGHNHGGQVCFPLVGPLIAPSLYGTRYAGGLYYEAPTILHVTRGISGEHPVRINCLPELSQLVLRCDKATS